MLLLSVANIAVVPPSSDRQSVGSAKDPTFRVHLVYQVQNFLKQLFFLVELTCDRKLANTIETPATETGPEAAEVFIVGGDPDRFDMLQS